MQIDLTDDESAELRLLLDDALGQLSHEIADTDNAQFRKGLRTRRTALDSVSRRLRAPVEDERTATTSEPRSFASSSIASSSFGSIWIDRRGSEVLLRSECLRLVALAARRGDTGRLGFPTDGAPIVVPANFGYDDTNVLLRVGPGTLADLVPGTLVAFEADYVDRQAGVAWSVLVRGLARALPAHDLHQTWQHLPEPLAPRPGDLMVSIRSDVVTGRRFALGCGDAPNAPDGER